MQIDVQVHHLVVQHLQQRLWNLDIIEYKFFWYIIQSAFG